MSFKIKGLDKLQKHLEELQKKAEKIDGVRNIPIEDVLTPSFLTRFTNFSSFQDLLQNSGYNVETQEDFENIPQDEWNTFISNNSQFSSWQDMLNAAAVEQVKEQIDL